MFTYGGVIMRSARYILFFLFILCASIGFVSYGGADTVQEVKKGTKNIWSDVKQAAKDTGKAVKDGAVKVGKGAKKGYQNTKEAVKKTVKGETKEGDK
jgi:hypothetical protein